MVAIEIEEVRLTHYSALAEISATLVMHQLRKNSYKMAQFGAITLYFGYIFVNCPVFPHLFPC